MREQGIVSASLREEEKQFEAALRPNEVWRISPDSRRSRKICPLRLRPPASAARRWITFCSTVRPALAKRRLPGLSRPNSVSVFSKRRAPVLQKKLDLSGILTHINDREVFFIDEIHRLMPDIEEMIYSALEDFRMDILIGTGPGARTHSMEIKRFTAIGATTRQGMISAPLRGRFGLVLRLNPYDSVELGSIVRRSARLLDVQIDTEGSSEIARRARGTFRASPIGCCAACAITRRCARQGTWIWKSRTKRSIFSKWIPWDSTKSIRSS